MKIVIILFLVLSLFLWMSLIFFFSSFLILMSFLCFLSHFSFICSFSHSSVIFFSSFLAFFLHLILFIFTPFIFSALTPNYFITGGSHEIWRYDRYLRTKPIQAALLAIRPTTAKKVVLSRMSHRRDPLPAQSRSCIEYLYGLFFFGCVVEPRLSLFNPTWHLWDWNQETYQSDFITIYCDAGNYNESCERTHHQ